MSNKKSKYIKKPFESTGISSDVSANIYMSMIESDAWKELTTKQHELYLYLKLQYYAQKRKPYANQQDCFYFNQTKWLKKYNLYSLGNKRGFYRDMSALIEYGFVDCVSDNANIRERNIYKYSNRWQTYKTGEKTNVPKKYMNLVLLRKDAKYDE